MWDAILYEISTLEFVLVTRLPFFCVRDPENSVADAMLSSHVAEIGTLFEFLPGYEMNPFSNRILSRRFWELQSN